MQRLFFLNVTGRMFSIKYDIATVLSNLKYLHIVNNHSFVPFSGFKF